MPCDALSATMLDLCPGRREVPDRWTDPNNNTDDD
jgi:hypothetical protein